MSLTSMLKGKLQEEVKVKSPLSMEEIGHLENGSLVQRILVKGTPEIGKTTFAWELCRRWAMRHILQEYDLLVMLQLSLPMVRESNMLADLFLTQLMRP